MVMAWGLVHAVSISPFARATRDGERRKDEGVAARLRREREERELERRLHQVRVRRVGRRRREARRSGPRLVGDCEARRLELPGRVALALQLEAVREDALSLPVLDDDAEHRRVAALSAHGELVDEGGALDPFGKLSTQPPTLSGSAATRGGRARQGRRGRGGGCRRWRRERTRPPARRSGASGASRGGPPAAPRQR